MHFRHIAIFGVSIVAVLIGSAYIARAAENIITDRQRETIRTNCTDLQATLNRVHQNDTLLRINRGNLYRTVSEKLMVPLNQRIAANQLDGGELSKIVADYNEQYLEFTTVYKDYETKISAAMKVDCTKQPTSFYDNVIIAHEGRRELYRANAGVVALAEEFQAEYLLFKERLNEGKDAR